MSKQNLRLIAGVYLDHANVQQVCSRGGLVKVDQMHCLCSVASWPFFLSQFYLFSKKIMYPCNNMSKSAGWGGIMVAKCCISLVTIDCSGVSANEVFIFLVRQHSIRFYTSCTYQ